jgi:hypothetical protein
MVAAAVAAGVAVAATAASTALSATQGGPDMPTLGGASGLEARMQRRNRDILFSAQNYANRGAYERNLVGPDIYRQAGYDVEYEPTGSLSSAARETRRRWSIRQIRRGRHMGDSVDKLSEGAGGYALMLAENGMRKKQATMGCSSSGYSAQGPWASGYRY